MSFAELFTEETIVHPLRAGDRDACFRELLDVLVSTERLTGKESARAFEAVLRREQVGSTGIGNGVAIPHVKLDGVKRLAAVLGVHSTGLDFRAIDGERVQIVFLVVRPADDQGEHLKFLQWVSRLGRNADFRRFLISARSPGEVVALLREMSEA